VFCVFDLLVHDGNDIRDWPLSARQTKLQSLLRKRPPSILLVEGFCGTGLWLYQQAVALELEGIVSKRLSSPYRSGVRWIRIKRPGAVPPERFKR
jgi:bifunctional non-homologous end joining protein LigD